MNNIQFDLDYPLFKLSSDEGSEEFTTRDACENVLILGGIGSGKTSGSYRHILSRYLKAGYGGLLLTSKQKDVTDILEYCASTGRSKDITMVEPGGLYHFNFLEYESTGQTNISYAQNVHQVLKTVIAVNEDDEATGERDPFWRQSLNSMILSVLDLAMLAYGKITLQLIYDIALSIPIKVDGKQGNDVKKETESVITAYKAAAELAKINVKSQIEAWRSKSVKGYLDTLSNDVYEELLIENIPDYRTLKMLNQFFMIGLYNINEKTRSLITFSLTGFLFTLLREPVYSLFCRYSSNFTPENCLNGKIIVLNLPVKQYEDAGRNVQVMFKYIWQRAMEKRNISANNRPVFLACDESSIFLHDHDADCQATARSSRVATLYVTQNISQYYSQMNGDVNSYRVKSFLGTIATKIFHANADLDTNIYASDLIGSEYMEDNSHSVQMSKEFSMSKSTSYKLEKIVRMEAFTRLKTGGPKNSYHVHAYIHMQGKLLKNGYNHQKICFNQKSII